jgi:hypothetical protein
MLNNTRRRALGLLAAAIGVRFMPPVALAATEKKDCLASKRFGPWKALATHDQAGARITEVQFVPGSKCDLFVDIQIGATFEGKIDVFGDLEGTQLPKEFLIKPENRILAKADNGDVAVDESLCGVCTGIVDDRVSIVLPLATAPLFRESASVEMTIKLGDKDDCRFKLDCQSLRQALDWAEERKAALATEYAEDTCTPPEGCFITSACCEVLGLTDDCFELVTLRRYRDRLLAATPAGRAAIARYYRLAPAILAALPPDRRGPLLLSVYARFILPSAIAAKLRLNGLAHQIYVRMIAELTSPRPKAPSLPH